MELQSEMKVYNGNALWGVHPLLWGPLPIDSGSVPQQGFVTFWLPAVFSQISVMLFFPSVGYNSFQFCSGFLS